MTSQSTALVHSWCVSSSGISDPEEIAFYKCHELTPCKAVGILSHLFVSKSEYPFDISYPRYRRVLHHVVLMTHLSNNKNSRQQTIRFSSASSLSSMTTHTLDGYLPPCMCLRCSQSSGRIQCAPQPPADHYRDPPSNGHCGMCEDCSAGACGDTRE